jgi:hypothetical protein
VKATVRRVLEDYATGMGLPLKQVKREFEALPEDQRFAVLGAMRKLESQHKQYQAGALGPVLFGAGGKELPPSGAVDADVVPIR